MEVEPREALFQKYVRWLEEGVQEDSEEGAGRAGEPELLEEAVALLASRLPEPAERFRVVPFYEVAGNALSGRRSAGLRGLETAFGMLETVCVNLLLFPWKKEFRCIKTFTGPYVYYLKEALCDSDLCSLLRSMGYTREQELRLRAGAPPGGPGRLRRLAFELFLARAECRLLSEAAARRGGADAEAEALETRRRRTEAERGRERAYLRRSTRASKSVDVADSSGSWRPPPRPVLRASLSLRCSDPDLDPGPVESRRAAAPPLSRARHQVRIPVTESSQAFPFPLGSLEELDLYTERAPPPCPPSVPPAPPHRPPARDFWGPRGQGAKCRGCGQWWPGSAVSLQSNDALCASCCPKDSALSCGSQDYPKPCLRPPDGPEKPSRHVPEKPPVAPRPYPGKLSSVRGGLRCGFCNKPGASHTCVSCSKVSCSTCVSLYAKDVCGRKNIQHSFTSNHQLGCRSGVLSHLVYR